MSAIDPALTEGIDLLFIIIYLVIHYKSDILRIENILKSKRGKKVGKCLTTTKDFWIVSCIK